MEFGDIDFGNIDFNDFGRVRDYNDFSAAASGASAAISMVTNLISLAIVVLMVIALWKVFKKAGKPGWHALIPFLNVYDLYIIAWKKKVAVSMLIVSICTFVLTFAGLIMFVAGIGGGFLSFFIHGGIDADRMSGGLTMFFVGLIILGIGACCSIVCAVFMIINYVKLGKAFGKSGGFLVGLALIPIVFLCILAFGEAEYQGYCDSEGFHPNEPGYVPNPGYGATPGYGQTDYQQGYNQEGYYQVGSDQSSTVTPPDYQIPEPPRYCSGCGTKIVPGSKFCNNCGKQLVK